MGVIKENPLKNVEKPPLGRRERILTGAERRTLFGSITDKAFKLFVFALVSTGARPSEIRYQACRELGIEPKFQEWDGQGSLVAFVISLNQHRRHLARLRLVGVGCRGWARPADIALPAPRPRSVRQSRWARRQPRPRARQSWRISPQAGEKPRVWSPEVLWKRSWRFGSLPPRSAHLLASG